MKRLRQIAMMLSFFLVLLDVGSHGFAREITSKVHGVQSSRRSTKETSSSTATSAVVGVSVDFLSNSNATMEEDKRVVPTGPNPLHNR